MQYPLPMRHACSPHHAELHGKFYFNHSNYLTLQSFCWYQKIVLRNIDLVERYLLAQYEMFDSKADKCVGRFTGYFLSCEFPIDSNQWETCAPILDCSKQQSSFDKGNFVWYFLTFTHGFEHTTSAGDRYVTGITVSVSNALSPLRTLSTHISCLNKLT